jgi:DNA-binding transcriptional MocR family regulator
MGDRLPGFFHSMRETGMVPLAAAAPAPELLPSARLTRALTRVARGLGAHSLRYDPLPGSPLLRRHLARRLAAAGCAVDPDELLISVGAIEALHLALQAVTRRGDAVLVESPCYFGVLELLSNLGLRAVEVPAHPATGLPVEGLEAILVREKVRACVVVPNFSNPLGSLAPVAAKRALVALCARLDVTLIESDVYGELPFEGPRPVPLKAFDKTGHVVHCSSFSKTLAPAYRVGWMVPGRAYEAVERLKFAQTVATPSVTQAALAEFLVEGGYDRHLRALRGALASQVGAMRELIGRHFPPGTRVSDPSGGFLLWVQLPERGVDSVTLQRRALTAGVSIAPGVLFGARAGFDHCLRLSCGAPVTRAVANAVATVGRLAASR